jgi:hypothetical protein
VTGAPASYLRDFGLKCDPDAVFLAEVFVAAFGFFWQTTSEYLKWVTTVIYHLLFFSSFRNHPTIPRYISEAVDNHR